MYVSSSHCPLVTLSFVEDETFQLTRRLSGLTSRNRSGKTRVQQKQDLFKEGTGLWSGIVLLHPSVGGEAGSGVEEVPGVGRRAVVQAPPRLGLDVASGLFLVLRSLLSKTRERGAVGW